MKKLYLSRTDKKLCGVCAGFANFLNIDPTIVRLIWAVLVLFYGAGVLGYVLCAFVIPDEPENCIED